MINNIYKMEVQYIKLFCEYEDLGDYYRFYDNHIKDMYSHNFIYIKEHVNVKDIPSIIQQEILYRKSQGMKFLRVMVQGAIEQAVFDQVSVAHDVEIFDYFGISSEQYTSIRPREGASVKLCSDVKESEHGRLVDIAANYRHMTLEFAIRRIDRKYRVYSDQGNALDLYVCYDGEEPVGNCELLVGDELAKIEDFDILDIYQRKGFGSHMIRSLLHKCYEKGIENAYLVTDHGDTAQEMYEKVGFQRVGQRTEVMYHLGREGADNQ